MSLEPVFAPTDTTRPRITVQPERRESDAAAPRWKGSFQKATLGDSNGAAWGGNGFGVDDFVDLINPLHHIPIVGHLYRALSGDNATAETKILGGALFGGPIGLMASAVMAFAEQEAAPNQQAALKQAARQEMPEVLLSASLKDTDPAVQSGALPFSETQVSAGNKAALSGLPAPLSAASIATLEDLTPPLPASAKPTTNASEPKKETPDAAAKSDMLSPAQHEKHEMILQLFGGAGAAASS